MSARADAFLFAGQGAQYVGMGSELFAQGQTDLFEEADDALGEALTDVMFRGSEADLTLTRNTQPAILTLSLVHHQMLIQAGLRPLVLLGHSLGEYAAWVAAGSLSFRDAVQIVRLRGEAMQEAVPVGVGAMSSIVSAAAQEVEALCDEVSAETGQTLCVSVYNCPGNTVVSGHAEAVAEIGARVELLGLGRVIPLKVSAPFHCPLLAPAAKRLEAALEQVELKANLLPVVPNVTASVVAPGASAQTIRALLVRQVVEAVRWEESLRAAIEFGATRSVCLGPGTALRSHMKRVSRRFALVSMDDSDQRKRLLEESIND